MRRVLKQGTRRIIRATSIVDGNGDPLTVDGWKVRGAARANTVGGALLVEWSSTPAEGQEGATAAGRTVEIVITPAMSSNWPPCDRVVVQVFITHPTDPTVTERIIDRVYDFDLEAIPA